MTTPAVVTPSAVAGKVRLCITTDEPTRRILTASTPEEAETLAFMILRAADDARQQLLAKGVPA